MWRPKSLFIALFFFRYFFYNGSVNVTINSLRVFPEFSTSSTGNDSAGFKKNFYRWYTTDLLINRLSFGYEHLIGKHCAFELDGFYKYHFHNQSPANEDVWFKKLIYQSEGAEIRAGISKLHHFDESCVSYGLSLAYRQQSFANQIFNTKPPTNAEFSLNQTKKALGLFFKLNLQFLSQKSAPEMFLMVGFYGSYSTNQFNWYYKNENGTMKLQDPSLISPITNKYIKSGFALIPCFNIGYTYRLKPPQKTWYRKIQHERDSLKYGKKNIVFYDPFQLLDGAVGFTYMRVFYKNAISLYNSTAIGLPGNHCFISNAVLVEKTLLYYFTHKKLDICLGANYNFTPDQQSFPYFGLSARLAQFEGNYHGQHPFELNKYYFYLNAGVVFRNTHGQSLLLGLSAGHYVNVYTSNNPWQYINAEAFHMRPDGGLNSAQVTIKFGQSF